MSHHVMSCRVMSCHELESRQNPILLPGVYTRLVFTDILDPGFPVRQIVTRHNRFGPQSNSGRTYLV
jgi:hypothetical protein